MVFCFRVRRRGGFLRIVVVDEGWIDGRIDVCKKSRRGWMYEYEYGKDEKDVVGKEGWW